MHPGNLGELLAELAKASLSDILIPLHILIITQCHQANLGAAKCVQRAHMHRARQMSSQLWEPTAVRRTADLQSDPCIPHPAVTPATQLPSRLTLDPLRLPAYVQIVSLILRKECHTGCSSLFFFLQSRVNGSNTQDSRHAGSFRLTLNELWQDGNKLPFPSFPTRIKRGGVACPSVPPP